MEWWSIAQENLIEDEGLRLFPYECPAGAITIGYGHNLDAKGIPLKVATELLRLDMVEASNAAEAHSYFDELTPERQALLVEMAFNLGKSGFDGFKRMHRALLFGDYELAATEIKDSNAYKQLPKRYGAFYDRMRAG